MYVCKCEKKKQKSYIVDKYGFKNTQKFTKKKDKPGEYMLH